MPEGLVGKGEIPSGSAAHRWLRGLIVLAATVCVNTASAQTNKPELRLGIGTFLTRDRGWNYHEQIEVFAALAQNAGAVDVEAGASLFKCFCGNLSYAAVSPPYPRPYQDGFAARLHVRTPGRTGSALSALLGAEVIHNRTAREANVTTAAGTAGVGVNFGSGRRGALDLRYVRFAKPLGSSRGILPLTLAWRL